MAQRRANGAWFRAAAAGVVLSGFAVHHAKGEQPEWETLRQQIQQRDRQIQEQDKQIRQRDRQLEQQDDLIKELARRLDRLERQVATVSPSAATAPISAGAVNTGSQPAAKSPVKPVADDAKPQPSPPVADQASVAQANPQPTSAPPPDGGGDNGGGSKGNQIKVDEEAAERALERTLVVEGALLVPFGKADIQPTFGYTRREFDNIPFPTSVNGFPILADEKVERNIFTPSLQLRAGLPWDSQFELGYFYQFVDVQNTVEIGGGLRQTRSRSGSGSGDVSLGLAKTFLREESWWPDVIGRVTYNIGSGEKFDDNVALSGGFDSITGQVSLLKRQDPLAFVTSASYQHTYSDGGIGPGNNLGFSLGVNLAASPETSLNLSLQQNFIDDLKVNGRTINNTNQVESSLVVGASTILYRNVLANVSAGAGLTEDAPDYFVTVSLPIRFNVPFPSLD